MKASKIAKLSFFIIIFASVIALVCMDYSVVASYTYSTSNTNYVSVALASIMHDVFESFVWLFYVVVVLLLFCAFAFDNKLISLASTVTCTVFICPVILKFVDCLQTFSNIKNNYGHMDLKIEFFILLMLFIVIIVLILLWP